MRRVIILVAATTAALLSVAGCSLEDEDNFASPGADVGAPDDVDVPQFTTGWGPARGHEDILRFGVDMADRYIAQYGPSRFYPSVSASDNGMTTNHPMVKGNYETDFPGTKMRAFYDAPYADWHNDGVLANMHSTRNHPGGEWESAHEACEGVRTVIAGATHEALRHAAAGDMPEALYWIGHATHTLEDSFGRAHTSRSSNWTLRDVCTYGEEISGACYHKTLDFRDRVWRETWSCQLNPWDRSWRCLSQEAQMASLVTAGYLILVEDYLAGYVTDIDAALYAFFEGGSSYPYSGYLNCDSL